MVMYALYVAPHIVELRVRSRTTGCQANYPRQKLHLGSVLSRGSIVRSEARIRLVCYALTFVYLVSLILLVQYRGTGVVLYAP